MTRAHWHHQINTRPISNQFQSSRFRLYKYPFRPLDMFGAERVNNRPTVIVHRQSKHYHMHSMMLRSCAWHRTGHLKSRQTGIIQIRWSITQGLEQSVSPPIFIIKAIDQGFSKKNPGDPNFSMKIKRDPKQKNKKRENAEINLSKLLRGAGASIRSWLGTQILQGNLEV